MTPREVIIAYLAALNQIQHQIDLEYDKMAGALIDRLSDAGFVIVPRKATEAMHKAAQDHPVSEVVNGMIGLAAVHGAFMPTEFHSPNTPLHCWWNAMIQEATKP